MKQYAVAVTEIVLGVWLLAGLSSFAFGVDGGPNVLSEAEWHAVCATHEADQHAISSTALGFQAVNPGQRWRIDFDRRGFLVHPRDGGWRWGLELVEYGFEACPQPVGDSAQTSSEGANLFYAWSDSLHEWYINNAVGLEHGYTIHNRPACPEDMNNRDPGPLVFLLRVRGNLLPTVHVGGRGLGFQDSAHNDVLSYSGLTVLDAQGNPLPAWFELTSYGIRLCVDETGAHYPLRVDPVAQEVYLKASNAQRDDNFGISAAVSGDTIVVGADEEDSSATGVNGNQFADGASDRAGAAYVFVKAGSTWTQQAYLKASNTRFDTAFGFSVAISDDTIVVGSPREDSNAVGVNGNGGDTSAENAGAAYVFRRTGTSWSQEAYLKASNSQASDYFGWAVAISGDTIVVSAPEESGGAVGVNGNASDNSATDAGAAYVFVRTGATWSQEAYLKPLNTDPEDAFGWSVAVCTDTIAVGSVFEDSNAFGVNGDATNNGASQSGAVHLFERSGTSWAQTAYLKASNAGAGDQFGYSVAILDDTLVIGAPEEGSSSPGVGADQVDNSAPSSGAAYVFTRNGSNWAQEAYLKSPNPLPGYQLGRAVAVANDLVVVGSTEESSIASGVNGDSLNSNLLTHATGAAFVFIRSGSNWIQYAYLKASNPEARDRFGKSVAASNGWIVVGATGEDGAVTGINPTQSNNNAEGAGAGYIFSLTFPPNYPSACHGDGGDQAGCTDCPCSNNAPVGMSGGCLNSLGQSAQLAASGLASISHDELAFIATGAVPSTMGVLFSSDISLPLNPLSPCFGVASGVSGSILDGLRCLGSPRRQGARMSNGDGDFGVSTAPWGTPGGPPGGLLQRGGWTAGSTALWQVFYRDNVLASCGSGLNSTNTILVQVIP